MTEVMHQPPEIFANHFWGQNDAGLDVLLTRMRQAKVVCDEVRAMVSARARLEEEYGRGLMKIGKNSLGKDETGTLRASLDAVRREIETTAQSHIDLAAQIRAELEIPLDDFLKTQREKRKMQQMNVVKAHRTKQAHTASVAELRKKYDSECVKGQGIKTQQLGLGGRELERSNQKYEKTQLAIRSADAEYKTAVKTLTQVTRTWNSEWKVACDKFQELEEERIDYLCNSLWNYANILSAVCVADDESCERIRLSLEECNVEHDISLFIREKATGSEIPEPLKYVDHYSGEVEDEAPPMIANFTIGSNPFERNSDSPMALHPARSNLNLGTSSPRASPRVGPTASPRVGPTASPRVGPTASPRVGPTASPRVGPTASPRFMPTASPRVGPSTSTTRAPADSTLSDEIARIYPDPATAATVDRRASLYASSSPPRRGSRASKEESPLPCLPDDEPIDPRAKVMLSIAGSMFEVDQGVGSAQSSPAIHPLQPAPQQQQQQQQQHKENGLGLRRQVLKQAKQEKVGDEADALEALLKRFEQDDKGTTATAPKKDARHSTQLEGRTGPTPGQRTRTPSLPGGWPGAGDMQVSMATATVQKATAVAVKSTATAQKAQVGVAKEARTAGWSRWSTKFGNKNEEQKTTAAATTTQDGPVIPARNSSLSTPAPTSNTAAQSSQPPKSPRPQARQLSPSLENRDLAPSPSHSTSSVERSDSTGSYRSGASSHTSVESIASEQQGGYESWKQESPQPSSQQRPTGPYGGPYQQQPGYANRSSSMMNRSAPAPLVMPGAIPGAMPPSSPGVSPMFPSPQQYPASAHSSPYMQPTTLPPQLSPLLGPHNRNSMPMAMGYPPQQQQQYHHQRSNSISGPIMQSPGMYPVMQAPRSPMLAPNSPMMVNPAHPRPVAPMQSPRMGPAMMAAPREVARLEDGRIVICWARAAYDYKAVMPEELGFVRGTLFAITLQQEDGWWEAEVWDEVARRSTGFRGLVPSNFVRVV